MKLSQIFKLFAFFMLSCYLYFLLPTYLLGNTRSLSIEEEAAFVKGFQNKFDNSRSNYGTITESQQIPEADKQELINPIERPVIKGQHHCINKDFKPKEIKSVWTMLNDNMDYVRGAVKMGRGVKRHTKTPLDLIVMELESKPLSEGLWEELSDAGFIKCVVESIPPPEKTRADLKEKYAVLHVWAMTVYDTVLFIDADTFVQNSLDDLINMDLQGKTIGVTKDIRERKWVDTFNSGVLLLHPRTAEFERLMKLLRSGMQFDFIMSDQGFLNAVYEKDWHEIGFVNNANLALYRFQRSFWDQHKLEDINIIHYTMQKPWKCKSKGPYGPICDVWINAK